jgi:hypothetical protein
MNAKMDMWHQTVLLFNPFGFKDVQYYIQKYFGAGLDHKGSVSFMKAFLIAKLPELYSL